MIASLASSWASGLKSIGRTTSTMDGRSWELCLGGLAAPGGGFLEFMPR